MASHSGGFQLVTIERGKQWIRRLEIGAVCQNWCDNEETDDGLREKWRLTNEEQLVSESSHGTSCFHLILK